MTAIPYTTRVRPDTGLTNARLGMGLFLLSEVMFYGALYSTYAFLRTAAEAWPAAGESAPLTMGLIALIQLTIASAAMIYVWIRVKSDSRASVNVPLLVVAIFATGYVATIGVEHRMLGNADVSPATSTYHAIYYLIGYIHRAHVAAGALMAAYLLGPGRTLQLRDSMAFANRAACIAWYWMFLGAAWLVAFVLFYTF